MRELKKRFQNEGTFRRLVYLAAAVMTLINLLTFAWGGGANGMGLYVSMMVITAAGTLLLYYISDGLPGFLAIMSLISKLTSVFVNGMTLLTAWIIGLGVLLQIIIPIVIVGSVLLFGLLFAYLFPVVFVPLFHFAGKLCNRLEVGKQEKAYSEKKRSETINSETRSSEKRNSEKRSSETRSSEMPEGDVDWSSVYRHVMSEVKK